MRAEINTLKEMLARCRCGIIDPVSDLSNQIQQIQQEAEQLQSEINNLITRFRILDKFYLLYLLDWKN